MKEKETIYKQLKGTVVALSLALIFGVLAGGPAYAQISFVSKWSATEWEKPPVVIEMTEGQDLGGGFTEGDLGDGFTGGVWIAGEGEGVQPGSIMFSVSDGEQFATFMLDNPSNDSNVFSDPRIVLFNSYIGIQVMINGPTIAGPLAWRRF